MYVCISVCVYFCINMNIKMLVCSKEDKRKQVVCICIYVLVVKVDTRVPKKDMRGRRHRTRQDSSTSHYLHLSSSSAGGAGAIESDFQNKALVKWRASGAAGPETTRSTLPPCWRRTLRYFLCSSIVLLNISEIFLASCSEGSPGDHKVQGPLQRKLLSSYQQEAAQTA